MEVIVNSIGSSSIDKGFVASETKNWLKKRNRRHGSVEVEIVGLKKIKALNKKYMGKDCPTDVLSFPLNPIPGEDDNTLIGTIVISNDIMKKQSQEKQTTEEEEFVCLLRHGIDHLVGINHR